MVKQRALQLQVTHGVASGIEIKKSVEADRFLRTDVCPYGSVRLESSACADAHYLKLCEMFFFLSGVEIDVGKGVNLVHRNVDVVASDTC